MANAQTQPAPTASSRRDGSAGDEERPRPKARTAAEYIQELKDLKDLLDAGTLNTDGFADLKAKLLRGD